MDSWAQQLELADDARRANHQPARDWLTHAGVTSIPSPKKDATPEITIEFGCSSHDEIEIVEVEEPPALPRTIRLSPEDTPPVENVSDE